MIDVDVAAINSFHLINVRVDILLFIVWIRFDERYC